MKDAILQIRMDSNMKRDVEKLYKEMGTSLAEAVRILAAQSLIQKTMPITMKSPEKSKRKSAFGIAKGKFVIPDDIDAYNDEIFQMFDADGSK